MTISYVVIDVESRSSPKRPWLGIWKLLPCYFIQTLGS